MYKKIENKDMADYEIKESDAYKQEYDTLLEYKAKGARITARILSIEFNEKSNSFREKKNVTRKRKL